MAAGKNSKSEKNSKSDSHDDDHGKGGRGNDTLAGNDGNDHINGRSGDDTISGGGGNDRLSGGKGNDTISGGDGNDRITGGKGNDTLAGDAGNDRIEGGKGDDTLSGGAGNDRLEGGKGNDTLVYNAALNVGAHDVYDGDKGNDTLLLNLTREEWFRPEVQADIARFLAWLDRQDDHDDHGNNGHGDHDDHGHGHDDHGHDDHGHDDHGHGHDDHEGHDDQFHFTAFDLTVRDIENLRVTVDGIELDPRDEAVTAVDDSATTDENAAVTGSVLDNDLVPDLVQDVRLVSDVARGALTLGADGAFSFDPGAAFDYLAAGESTTETFTYEVEDADGDTAQATMTLTVTGSNDGPVITAADTSGAAVELTDADADENTAVHAAAGAIAFADLDLSDAHTVSAVAQGVDYLGTFSALVADGSTGDGAGSIDWNFSVNDSALDSLAAGDVLVQSYAVSVDDGHGGTATETVTVTLTGTNDAPVIAGVSDAGAVSEDDTLAASGDLDSSDVDVGATAAWSVVGGSAGTYGSLGVDAGTGEWTYTLNNDAAVVQALAVGETHDEMFTVLVTDDQGATDSHDVTVTVTGTNDAPVIGGGDAEGSVTQEAVEAAPVATPIVFTVEQYLGVNSNDFNFLSTYAANNPASYTVQTNVIDFTDDPSGFAGELPGSSPWPAEAATGQSGTGSSVNTDFFARVTTEFSVTNADTYTFRTFNDDGVQLKIDGVTVINDTNYHGETPFEGSIALAPGNHSLELFFFEHQGEASLELSVRDSSGSFGLLGANGGGLGGTALELTDSGLLSFTDIDLTDGHTVAFTPADTGYLGTFTVNLAAPATGGATGEVAWDFAVDNDALVSLGADDILTQTYTVSVDDGNGGTDTQDVTVTINGVNDAPVAGDDAFSVDEDGSIVGGTVAGNDSDIDGDALTFALGTGPAHGSLTLNADGSFDYTPDADFNGTDSFGYTVDDGNGGTDTATASITVNAVNDAPVASDDAFAVDEDGVLNGLLAGNDSDVEGDALTFALGTGPAHGSVTVNADGSFDYTPDADFNGTDSFDYTVDDGNGGTDTATASITVNPVNDAPVIQSALATGGQLVQNGSFETGTTGWTVSNIDRLGSFPGGWQPSDGSFSLDLNSSTPGSVQQNVATVAGQLYAVEFDLSKNPGFDGSPDPVETVRVSADAATQDFTYTTVNSAANMQWQDEIFVFTATDNSTTLNFASTDAAGDFEGPALDNVSMVAVAYQTNEDTALTINGISISDVDAATVQATLSVAHGGLTLADTLGLDSFSGNGTGSVSLTGSLAEVNQALSGMHYLSSQDYNGLDSLNVSVTDLGNTGSGGPLTDNDSFAILVDAVNDAPVAADDAFTFSGTGGPINISGASLVANDSDVEGDSLTVTAVGNASGGTVSLSGGNVVFTPDVVTGAAVATFGDGRLVNGLGGTDGFGENVLNRNDDSSTAFIDLSSVFGDGLDFFGTNYTGLYVNNNGNVTFGGSLSTFTPFGLTAPTSNPIIAPFFADVDTNGGDPGTPTPGGNSSGSNNVYYDLDTTNHIFTATWDDVGYYSQHNAPLDAFQLQLYDRGNGDFDIVFRYENINWTTGDASGGSGGLGGTVARAGWNSGNGTDFFELPASGNQTGMLDLDSSAGNLDTGVWQFEVRGGTVAGNDGFDYTVSDGHGGTDTAFVDLHLLF